MVQLETSSVSPVLLTVLRSVILVPSFLSVLQLLSRPVSLVPLIVAFLVLSTTKHIPRTVPIRSWPTSLFSMQSFFGYPASLLLSVGLFLLCSFIFLVLTSFFLFRHYVLSLNSYIYVEFCFLCLRDILVPHFSISSSCF